MADFRFHDLRHTWASWHVQNGTPLMTLKELGGWEKLEMVNKYAHLSTEHLRQFSGIVTFLAQSDAEESLQPSLSVVSI
ncbi:integrase [Pectobacterium betavasculorum]|uniref:Integrase n=1 Tax=Pectobacterium betavasculorum TaxID=55207 RepID=A0ABR4V0W8_9GAMM|nr:integrase [Pectobacterium betavasculorum]